MKSRRTCRTPSIKLARTAIVLFALVALTRTAHAVNPFVTTNYDADPSARVFDGRLYVYPSHDRDDARVYDMDDYRAYSTDDLQNWQDHGTILSLADIPWAKGHLWAPDCGYKNGTYFLYYPADSTGKYVFKLGVATSKSPAGPFVDSGHPIAGTSGIDPAFFMDDDGQAYLIWSSKGPTIAKLKPNLMELDGPPVKPPGCKNFFEGPWMFKRQGTYYLTYPAFKPHGAGRGGHGQHFDYATAPSPTGPFTYRGTFSQSGPGGDNIHGSQVEYQGKWYCFYHDFSDSVGRVKQGFKRCLHVDLMDFGPDGSILPLKWTTTGPPQLKPLNAYAKQSATCLCQTDVPEGPHAVTVDACSEGGQCVGPLSTGDWLRYAGMDFGPPSVEGLKFEARVATPVGNGTIELHLDRVDGPLLGRCPARYTGGWQVWQTTDCAIKDAAAATGVHDVYLVCDSGAKTPQLNLQWFQFDRVPAAAHPSLEKPTTRTTQP